MKNPTVRVPIAAVAAAVALALLAPAPGAVALDAAPVRVGENVPLGDDPRPSRGRDRPGLAVNPADPNHVVAVDEDFIDGQCNYHVSFDAGRTWASGHLRGPAGFPSPPCVQFDTGGWSHANGSVAFGSGQNVYTTYNAFRPGEGDSIVVNRSTDGGRSFAPANVAVQGLPSGRTTNNRPGLAVLPRAAGDKVVISYWGCETPGVCSRTHRAHSVVSTNGGQTWGTPAFLNLPTDGPAPYPSPPTVGPDGAFYVTFRRQLAANPPRGTLVLATSRNDGTTWTYEDVATVAGLNEQKVIADPRDGTLYVAYHATLTGSDEDIVFQRRPAGSTAWSAPLRVNDDPPGTNVSQRFPAMSLAPSGRIDLLWHDRRHPYPGNDLDDYYYATSTDGGRSFSANRRVTDRTINMDVGLDSRIGTFAFYWPALAAVGDSTVLAAWPDSRDGNHDNDNQDVYTARLETPAAGPPPSRAVAALDPTGLAATLSRLAYPGGREVGASAATTTTRAVIVNEGDAASAVVGAVLARANLGPVLLSGAAGLPAASADEVRRLGSVGAFLIGNETQLSAQVVADLKAAGVPEAGIVRIAGTDAPDTARLVAQRLDTRSDANKTAGVPAFTAVVVANPATREAASASALAAALRLPYLLVDAAAVPQPTLDALKSLNINKALVIGGPAAVGDEVLAKLPDATRLGGDDAAATSVAVAREARTRGLPLNVAYAGDVDRPVESAVLGAAVARLGGLMVLVPGADVAAAEGALARSGLESPVDRIVSVRSSGARAAVSGPRPAPAAAPAAQLPATGGGSSLPAVSLLLASVAALRLGSRRGRRRAAAAC